ncbi:hypothetical protein D3C71_1913840 [compost metagenome]
MRRHGTQDRQIVQRLRGVGVLCKPLLERNMEEPSRHIVLGRFVLGLAQIEYRTHIQYVQMRQRRL